MFSTRFGWRFYLLCTNIWYSEICFLHYFFTFMSNFSSLVFWSEAYLFVFSALPRYVFIFYSFQFDSYLAFVRSSSRPFLHSTIEFCPLLQKICKTFDRKNLEKRFNRGWWNFRGPFFPKLPFLPNIDHCPKFGDKALLASFNLYFFFAAIISWNCMLNLLLKLIENFVKVDSNWLTKFKLSFHSYSSLVPKCSKIFVLSLNTPNTSCRKSYFLYLKLVI